MTKKLFFYKVPHASGFVLLLGVMLLVFAIMIHAFSSLPNEYSWNRTLVLFWNAVTDRFFVVITFFVLASALAALPGASGFLVVTKQLCKPRKHVISLMILSVCGGLALAVVSSAYTRWDHVFAPLVVLLFLCILKSRNLGHTLLGLLLSVMALALVSYVFTIFKSQLFVFGIILDEWIVAGERLLFGEPLYVSIAEWSGQHPLAVEFSDWVYYLFFHHMALVAFFLYALGNRSEQWRYVTSLTLCYLLGGLSYYIFPALGPVFFDPSKFTYLEESAKFTVVVQNLLWQSTNAAVEGRLEKIETYAFIACMPSLHMAHETIMLYFSRVSSVMLFFSMVYWLASFLAVLVLGWHYLFDVFGGVFLAVIVLSAVQWSHRSERVLLQR